MNKGDATRAVPRFRHMKKLQEWSSVIARSDSDVAISSRIASSKRLLRFARNDGDLPWVGLKVTLRLIFGNKEYTPPSDRITA